MELKRKEDRTDIKRLELVRRGLFYPLQCNLLDRYTSAMAEHYLQVGVGRLVLNVLLMLLNNGQILDAGW